MILIFKITKISILIRMARRDHDFGFDSKSDQKVNKREFNNNDELG